MVRINHKSDFEVDVTLQLGGEPMPIPENDFKVVFYVFESRQYTCEHSGDNWLSCERIDDYTLRCYLDGHDLGLGALKVEFYDYAPDEHYADGDKLTVTPRTLDIMLVAGAGDADGTIRVELPYGDIGHIANQVERNTKNITRLKANVANRQVASRYVVGKAIPYHPRHGNIYYFAGPRMFFILKGEEACIVPPETHCSIYFVGNPTFPANYKTPREMEICPGMWEGGPKGEVASVVYCLLIEGIGCGGGISFETVEGEVLSDAREFLKRAVVGQKISAHTQSMYHEIVDGKVLYTKPVAETQLHEGELPKNVIARRVMRRNASRKRYDGERNASKRFHPKRYVLRETVKLYERNGLLWKVWPVRHGRKSIHPATFVYRRFGSAQWYERRQ